MDHASKYKMQKYKTSGGNIGNMFGTLDWVINFMQNTKSTVNERKNL